MKKTIKLFGIIVLAAVMVFAMTACGDGGGGGSPPTPPSPKTLETAKYVSFDETTGNMLELVIKEAVSNARYTAKEGDEYILTIYSPDGTVLATSNGKVSSASGNEIVLEHSTGAVITVAVSTSGDSSIITSLDTDDDTIPVDTGSSVQTVQKPALISYTPGLEFELLTEGDYAGTYSVSKGTSTGVVVIIPMSYEGKAVTEIHGDAFKDTKITSVTIPSSITWIRYTAFGNCTELTSVTFAEGSQPKFIGYAAFLNCTGLKSITIPASVKGIINWGNFEGCTSLESVIFAAGSQLETIGGGAFVGCTSLKNITIPASVTSIEGWGAFDGCKSLASVTFEAGSKLETIGGGAFKGTNITSITIPASVTSIGEWSLQDTSLTSVTFEIGSKLETISDGAFDGSTNITNITIPAGVKETGPNFTVFGGWTSSQTINLPFASREKAIETWGHAWTWANDATIKYWNGSSYE